MKIEQIRKGKPYIFSDSQTWGGKGDNLLKLAEVFDVPQGFVISADTYVDWAREAGIQEFVADVLKGRQEPEQTHQQIKQRFMSTDFGGDLVSKLQQEFSRLKTPVAVRSSSPSEDGEKNSFAGRHETVLGVTTTDEFFNAMREVYASLFTPQSIAYRKAHAISGEDSMALVVQTMISPEVSGVAYSPSPANQSEILIESAWGLGTSVVDARPCDIFRVRDTVTGDIIRDISPKKLTANVFDKQKKTVVEQKVLFWSTGRSSLTDPQVRDVAKAAKTIERAYGMPMDIEFAIEQGTGRFYLLQARPITGLGIQEQNIVLPNIPQDRILGKSHNIRKQGIFEGPAVVVTSIDYARGEINVDGVLAEMDKQFSGGYVLLAPEVPPQLESHLTNVRGMAITECGTTGHAAAVAAERGIVYLGRVEGVGQAHLLQSVRSGTRVGIAASKSEGLLYLV